MRQLQPSAILSAACCAAVMLAAAAPAGAATTLPRFGGIVFPGKAEPLPKIDNVEFSGGSAGINVTLNGSNFGTAPVDVPCNQCTPIEVQVLDLAVEGVPEVINVASWTNTSISLPNLTVNPGDALEIDAGAARVRAGSLSQRENATGRNDAGSLRRFPRPDGVWTHCASGAGIPG